MSDRIIVVTGATGKTGKLLIEELKRRPGVKVRAAVRSVAKARALFSGVDVAEMDYTRPETVEAALAGAHALYLVTPGGSEQVEQTWVTVDAARRAGLARIVKLGSQDAKSGKRFQVERWCKMTEAIVASSGIAHTFLRPTWFNQNFTEYLFAPQVKMGLVAAPTGEGKAGWIDCRDIAAVAAVTLTEPGHDGKAYTLTGPESISMRDIARMLSDAAGRTIRYFDAPPALQRWMSRLAGFPPRDVAAIAELIGTLREGESDYVTDDVERVTGRAPIRFETFARDHAAQLRR